MSMQARRREKGRSPHPLVGSWVNGDEYGTDVEYSVAQRGQTFAVSAVDRFDGEAGTVYDVSYDADSSALSFNVRWASTGRFICVRLMSISPNRVSYTYTYTENQMWFRKGTEPGTSSQAHHLGSDGPATETGRKTPREGLKD